MLQHLISALADNLDDPELAAIHARLLTCGYMVKEEARVHYECNRKLNWVSSQSVDGTPHGRPQDMIKADGERGAAHGLVRAVDR